MPVNPLAIAARFEVTERERLYPTAISAGKISRDTAERDTECWDVIACALETGGRIDVALFGRNVIGWQDMRDAIDRAVKSRARAVDARPDDTALVARAANVNAIATTVGPKVDFWIEINRLLRARGSEDRLSSDYQRAA
jgi:hypothetical protein